MTVAAGGPIFCFVVLLKSLKTVVKSVGDGLSDDPSFIVLTETKFSLSLRLN